MLSTFCQQHLGAFESSQLVLVVQAPNKDFSSDGGCRLQARRLFSCKTEANKTIPMKLCYCAYFLINSKQKNTLPITLSFYLWSYKIRNLQQKDYTLSGSSHLPAAVFSSSSSSLSDARKGTVARSSSSARMRPTMFSPWILQSIPELRHCLIAISIYLWNCVKLNCVKFIPPHKIMISNI